jgi:hypothetical protein
MVALIFLLVNLGASLFKSKVADLRQRMPRSGIS